MLSLGAITVGKEEYYLGLSQESYYVQTQGGEPPGVWVGEGSSALGLEGVVGKEDLRALFRGVDPRDPERELVQNVKQRGDRKPRRAATDLCFSVPKTVSCAFSQADPKTQLKIQEIQQMAVKKAISWVEDNLALTRCGKDGVRIEKCKLIAALFEHGTSRAHDPQLHTHALLLNLSVRDNGKTGAFFNRSFYKNKMLLGALYRAELSYLLESELGLTSHREKSWFELDGNFHGLPAFFSKRRRAIEKALKESCRASARESAYVSLATRETKKMDDLKPRSEHFSDWQAVGKQMGFSWKEYVEIMSQSPRPERFLEKDKFEVVSEAVAEITEAQAHFTKTDLLRRSFEVAQGRGLSSDQVIKAVEEHPTISRELVSLGVISGEERYTTQEMLRIEKELFSSIEKANNESGLTASISTADKAIKAIEAKEKFTLSSEQKNAVQNLTTEPGNIHLLTGEAGTGKTTVLEACNKAWRSSGYNVMGVAISNRAARQMEETAGIKSSSIAAFLYEAEKSRRVWDPEKRKAIWDEWRAEQKKKWNKFQAWSVPPKWNKHIEKALKEKFEKETPKHPLKKKNTILVVDEAGMVDTRTMKRLQDEVRARGCSLKLIGDKKQIQPVLAGAPFGQIKERLENSPSLTEIRRQREPWMRKTVRDFSQGDAQKALEEYAKRGFLTVGKDFDDAKERLVADLKQQGFSHAQDSLVLCNERQHVSDMNRRIQSQRFVDGQLGVRAFAVGDDMIHKGDRVVFTRNQKPLGVDNGDFGVVESIDKKRSKARIRLDRGFSISISTDDLQGNLTLGYASTVYKAQGCTVKYVYVLAGGGMQDREATYVQMSRAKVKTRVYIDEIELSENASLDDSQLIKSMSRSRQKDTVSDLLKRAQLEKQNQQHQLVL